MIRFVISFQPSSGFSLLLVYATIISFLLMVSLSSFRWLSFLFDIFSLLFSFYCFLHEDFDAEPCFPLVFYFLFSWFHFLRRLSHIAFISWRMLSLRFRFSSSRFSRFRCRDTLFSLFQLRYFELFLLASSLLLLHWVFCFHRLLATLAFSFSESRAIDFSSYRRPSSLLRPSR